ncbi:MAG: hypothetical protein FWK04_12635 [Nostoc sp. GBBB01]|nr:hypothetical protein [Nostoc sp. GBBB01]
MSTHCSVGSTSKVSYSFNGEKQTYETVGPVEVTTGEGSTSTLLKFGSSATVPTSWGGADVYLYGIVFTAPNYPNCPSDYIEILIGTAQPGQVLTLVQTPRANVCTNAYIMAIPQLNYDNFDRQWNGNGVGIGLKENTSKCTIQIVNSEGYTFSKAGECPIKYEVACDEECPEGSHKCIHKKYPGYCCVPCKEVGERIKNIASKVRG